MRVSPPGSIRLPAVKSCQTSMIVYIISGSRKNVFYDSLVYILPGSRDSSCDSYSYLSKMAPTLLYAAVSPEVFVFGAMDSCLGEVV